MTYAGLCVPGGLSSGVKSPIGFTRGRMRHEAHCGTSFSSRRTDSSTAPAGRASIEIARARDGFRVSVVQNPTLVTRRRRPGHPADHRRPGRTGRARRPLLRRRGHHRGRHRTRTVAALVYVCALRAGQGGVGRLAASPVSRPTARSRRSCRLGTASCSWTGTNSTPRSPPTCPPNRPRSMADAQVPVERGGHGRSDHRSLLADQAAGWYLVTDPGPDESRRAAQRTMAGRIGATQCARSRPASSVYGDRSPRRWPRGASPRRQYGRRRGPLRPRATTCGEQKLRTVAVRKMPRAGFQPNGP